MAMRSISFGPQKSYLITQPRERRKQSQAGLLLLVDVFKNED